ncbi:MAG: MG2 domain-containing protein [bacterium]
MKRLSGLLFLAGLFVFAALVLILEKPTGSMKGVVVGEDGRLLAGAVINLDAYPVSRKAVSDAEGQFRFDQLPIGKYFVNASRRGYQPAYLQESHVTEGAVLDLGKVTLKELAPNLSVSVWNNTKLPDEKIQLSTSGAKVRDIHFEAFQIDLPKFLSEGKKYSDLEQANAEPQNWPAASRLKEWDEKIPEEDIPEFDRKVKVPVEGTGLFLFRATASSLDRQQVFTQVVVINKTDLGFITKRDADKVLVFASTMSQPAPASGIPVALYPEEGPPRQAQTNADGIAEFDLSGSDTASGSLFAVAGSGNSLAFSVVPTSGEAYADEGEGEAEAEGEGEGAESQPMPAGSSFQTFLYTERPLYRPGQKVYFKGIARLQKTDGEYLTPPTGPVSLSIEDPKGNILWEDTKARNANGAFWGDFDLGEEADLGYYRIKAVVGGKEFTEDFEVDEYRKPEFKVEIRPDKPRYFSGDKIQFLIDTQYYFGAPVEAEIGYTVYKSSYYYSPPGEEYLPDIFEEGEYYGGYGEFVSEGKGKTDKQGHLNVEVPTERSEQDERYTLRVTATDITNRQVTTENSAIATAGDFYFRTQQAEFLGFPKKPFALTVLTKDYDGKPVRQAFEVRVEREVWDPIASSYDYKKESTAKGETGANGEGQVTLNFERGGYYRLLVSGKDRGGRKVAYEDYVWVSGSAQDSEDFGLQKELKIVTDKKKYDAGETAKIFLVGPVKNGRILLSIEGMKIYQYQVVTLDGFSKEIELPLKAEWEPNIFVSATTIGKKEYYEGTAELAISPKEHYLDVEIKPDAQTYRPAGNITYTIVTKDMTGKPVPAEVSLGVVDESIYALRADNTDIKNFFWGPRSNRVSTNYSFSGYYTGGIEKEDRNLLRRNFKDTAYWLPAIQTAADGSVSATFTLPDNLTTWRATVVAHTPATEVGQQINKVISSKELIARIATPRFFTERDQVRLKAILNNYTDKPQNLRVSLGVEGVDFANPKDGEPTNVTIEPKGVASFEFTVLPKQAGTAKIQLLAKNDQVSDGVELKIPVLPHGIEDHQYAQGEVQAGSQTGVKLVVPPKNDPKRSKLKVTLDTSFVAQLLGPLGYLVDYPYGCVEQTMSRLLPAITVSNLYKSLGLSDPMLEKKLPKVIDKGLKRILRYQHADGGWGWWKDDETDPFMTAYALYGLIRAEQLGEKVPADAIQKGKEALEGILKPGTALTKTYMLGPEATVYYLHYVASIAGIKNSPPMPRAEGVKTKLAQALLVLALDAQGKREVAANYLADLERAAICENALCHYSDGDTRTKTFGHEAYWQDPELTAWVLQALIASGRPNQNLKDSLVRWLLTQRQGGMWSQTRATATVLYALADYAKGLPGVKSGVSALLTLNGQALEKVAVASAHFVRNVPQPALKTGDNDLGISNLLTTPLYYQSDLATWSQEENLAPVAEGIRVKREYVVLSDQGADDSGARLFKASPLKGKLKKGEIIGVRLTVESDQNLSYLILEDPFPSGFETVDGVRFDPNAAYYADSERRDEKIAFFINYLEKGSYIFNYALRPELAGTFGAMPSQAYEMYRPEVRGSGASAVLEVE